MKTAGRGNPNRWAQVSSNRAQGAAGQNRSCSFKWAAKQERFQPPGAFFFLTSLFIELHRPTCRGDHGQRVRSGTNFAMAGRRYGYSSGHLPKGFRLVFSNRLKDSAYRDSVFSRLSSRWTPIEGMSREDCGPYLFCGFTTRRIASCLCILQQRRGRIPRAASVY
jgi:hypothetical protein